MKQKNILATILSVAVLFAMSGCGNSDHLQSITLTPGSASGVANLPGVDATLQLAVTANYNSGKTVIVTNESTFSVTTVGTDDNGNALPPYGPNTVPISTTGMMTAVGLLCTWTDANETTGTPPNQTTAPANPPVWEYTGYYQVTASYKGMTSQPAGIGVGSVASNNSPIGGCGPS